MASCWISFSSAFSGSQFNRQLTRATALDVKSLMHICEQDHELGYALMKRYGHMLAVQFRVITMQMADMYG